MKRTSLGCSHNSGHGWKSERPEVDFVFDPPSHNNHNFYVTFSAQYVHTDVLPVSNHSQIYPRVSDLEVHNSLPHSGTEEAIESVNTSAFVGTNPRFVDAVNVRSICNSNQFQIVRRKDFPFRISHFESAQGFPGTFIQNLKTFLAAGEEITFSPLPQSNDDRERNEGPGNPSVLRSFTGSGNATLSISTWNFQDCEFYAEYLTCDALKLPFGCVGRPPTIT